MLVLVLGASFPVMFVGWEGVGLCSYLLIGFWFKKQSAADAGKKAFIVNRIGDFGFILGMLLIFATFHTLDFQAVAAAAASRAPETMGMGVMTIATLLLFLGATGKSAQIPLYVWLPDAMEGPTPVSALIHAATMVTAGVYMIGRNAVLFQHAPTTLVVVAGIGAATALMAGTIGLVQNDIKRVLAYSTVSQLGYMFLAMGVGAYAAGIFHLYTHAFFKALLFLGSGAVIHALAGEQDLRNMGGLRKALPITYWTFLIGAIAIAGVPPLAGFFSKDEILFRTFTSDTPAHTLLWGIGMVTSLLTATYMFRLVFMAFHGERRHDAPAAPAHPEEEAARRRGEHLGRRAVARKDVARRAVARRHATCTTPHPRWRSCWSSWPSDPSSPALSACRTRSAAAIASSRSSNRASKCVKGRARRTPRPRRSRARTRCSRPPRRRCARPPPSTRRPAIPAPNCMLMGLSVGVAAAGIGLAFYFWLRNRKAADAIARSFSGVHRRAAQQVLRRRAVRRGSRSADQAALDGGVVEGRGRRPDRRRRQRCRPERARRQRRAPPRADRLGPDVCGVALPRRGADYRVLPGAVGSDGRSGRLSSRPYSTRADRRIEMLSTIVFFHWPGRSWCCWPAGAAIATTASRSCAPSRLACRS